MGKHKIKYHKIEGFDSQDESGSWLLPYTTLMTILMIFFMVLWAYSFSKDKSSYEKSLASMQKSIGGQVEEKWLEKAEKQEQEQDAINKITADQGLKQFADLAVDQKEIKISFSSPMLFDSGKEQINDKMKELLESISFIKDMPNEVVIEGHTDNTPISTERFSSNWELSIARARSVAEYLLAVYKISPSRIALAGYGEFQPQVPNDTPENRARNRRIEVKIIRFD